MQDTAIVQTIEIPAQAAALSSIAQIEKLKEEVKTLTEMQSSVLENDPDYSNAYTNRVEASEVLKRQRQRVFEQNPELIERQEQIKELRATIKEVKGELGYQLGLFQQQTGSSVLESPGGERYHIINNYKKGKDE